ncbi:MAG: amidohydrolase family protein [Bryobacteraceae bacterium]
MRARLFVCVIFMTCLPWLAEAETQSFSVIFGGKNLGHVTAETKGELTTVDFDFKNNGRGPTISETIRSGAEGMPVEWSIKGTTTFGSKVDERFQQSGGRAAWTDSTGPGSAAVSRPALYVPQSGSPWQDQIMVHALLRAAGMTLPVLPSGRMRLEKGETLLVKGGGGAIQVTRYDLIGNDLSPTVLLVDTRGDVFAEVSPTFVVIRKGYETESERLAALAGQWSTQRLAKIEKKVAHRYAAPVRIRNVRIFDAKKAVLTEPVSVVVYGKQIAAVDSAMGRSTSGEVTIDGEGGILVPGMYEMHSHLNLDDALLNVMAGITTVRDMGNDNAVLDKMIDRIDSAEVGGPRVVRSGFIEGKSPFSANHGFVVDSEEQALAAVRWYGARGFWQVKIYNSMNPDWAPAIAREAHRLGMRVAGHVPAFSTADQMLEAGYDEITHINQFMLGWVIDRGEDTRTLFRLTGMKRFSDLDLSGSKVQHTIQLMVEGHKAIDPTLGIHEQLTLNRDGHVPPGAVDYLDHMPLGVRRSLMKARTAISSDAEDRAYREAFEKILATVRLLHDRGVFIVFGTDTGGSFTFHRELELYQGAGMTPPEILKRATFDAARYLGQDQRLGSIEKGKLADFFLIPTDPTRDLKAIKKIRMVVKDGTFYFPSEVYPNFGIEPFASAPKVN